MMQKELTIGEVAHYADIEASAIRYYESVGLLPKPKRINGRRRYDPSVLKRLMLIHLSRQVGFRIGELQVLFSTLDEAGDPATSWQHLAAAKIKEMNTLIEQTTAARAWLKEALAAKCNEVGDCISINIDEQGDTLNVTLSCGEMELI